METPTYQDKKNDCWNELSDLPSIELHQARHQYIPLKEHSKILYLTSLISQVTFLNQKLDDVAVFYYVVFAFGAEFAGFAGFGY
jgi:hypothetical protein